MAYPDADDPTRTAKPKGPHMPTPTTYKLTIGPTMFSPTATYGNAYANLYVAVATLAFYDENAQPVDPPAGFALFVPPTPGLSVNGSAAGNGYAVRPNGVWSTTFVIATAKPGTVSVPLTNTADLPNRTLYWRAMPYTVTFANATVIIEQNDANGVPIAGQITGTITWTTGSPPSGLTFTVRPLTSGLMVDSVAAPKTYSLANGTATFTLTAGTPGFYRFDVLNNAGLPELALPLGVSFSHPREVGSVRIGTPAGTTTAIAN